LLFSTLSFALDLTLQLPLVVFLSFELTLSPLSLLDFGSFSLCCSSGVL
jgi:hypothetical protein